MKKNWILVILIGILFLYNSCDDKDISETSHVIIEGKCTFYNVFEGAMQTNDSIEFSIESLSPDTVLPAGMPKKLIGSEYLFGPLYPGDYVLSAKFVDTQNSIIYETSDTLKVSEQEVIVHDMILTPSNNTQFVKGRIYYKDILSNKLSEAESLVVSKIECINSFVVVPNNGESLLPASEYMFGPLVAGDYLLSFKYSDVYGLMHELKDTVLLDQENKIETKDYLLELNDDHKFIKGQIKYKDILTGKLNDVLNFKTAEIRAFNSYSQLPNNGESLMSAPDYMFGPLEDQNYIQTFIFEDDYGLVHSTIDTLYMNNLEVVNERNYALTNEPNTILIAQLVDSVNNGVSEVKVYLYNNYSYLLKHQEYDGRAAIDSAISNKDGKVVFKDLNPIKYYIYGYKIYGKDTLTTLDSEYNPEAALTLIKDSINLIQSVLK